MSQQMPCPDTPEMRKYMIELSEAIDKLLQKIGFGSIDYDEIDICVKPVSYKTMAYSLNSC
jgi:hypothetical protein